MDAHIRKMDKQWSEKLFSSFSGGDPAEGRIEQIGHRLTLAHLISAVVVEYCTEHRSER